MQEVFSPATTWSRDRTRLGGKHHYLLNVSLALFFNFLKMILGMQKRLRYSKGTLVTLCQDEAVFVSQHFAIFSHAHSCTCFRPSPPAFFLIVLVFLLLPSLLRDDSQKEKSCFFSGKICIDNRQLCSLIISIHFLTWRMLGNYILIKFRHFSIDYNSFF